MTQKAKVRVGFCALVVLCVMLLLLCLHYRSQYRRLAESVAAVSLPSDERSRFGPSWEPWDEVARLQAARVLSHPDIEIEILGTAVARGIRKGLRPLEADIGIRVPRGYFLDLHNAITSAITIAGFGIERGEGVGEALTKAGYTPSLTEEELPHLKHTWSHSREDLESLFEAVKRRLEEFEEPEQPGELEESPG